MGFSTGLAMHLDSDDDMSLIAFPVEGGLALSIAPMYDLAFSVSNYIGSVEGNLAVYDGGVRFGVLHGLGLGLFATQDDSDLFAQLGGGLFMQTGRRKAFFTGVKYNHSRAFGSSDAFAPTNYLTVSAGLLPSGVLRLTPEVVVNHARWRAPSLDPEVTELQPRHATTVIIGLTLLNDW